jgi:subtilisin-like proprotein convertase family protein
VRTRGTLSASCLTLALIRGRAPVAAEPVADETSKHYESERSATELVTSPEGTPQVPLLAVLYDQTTAINESANSQNYETSFDDYDDQAADDFVVSSLGWNVTRVFAPGNYTATHRIPTSVRVAFYADAAGVPGAVLCNFPTQPFVEGPSGTFTIGIPGCVLTPGRKWVSVVANLDIFGGAGGQWFWSTRTVLTGNPAKWQNPGGGLHMGCGTWGNVTTCLNGTDPDMAFRLEGNVTSCGVNADCSDGDLCNGVETCVGNVCQAGTSVNCDDGLFCTVDTCTPATGACVHAPNPCADGNPCTVDNCHEVAGCLHDNQCSQFCSAGGITIPDSTSPPTLAVPYPSAITVSGFTLPAALEQVDVTISHTFPDDIDMLLVGPGGQNAIILSDVGANADVTNLLLKLSDAGTAALPDAGPLVAGTFRPTNVTSTPADAWPAPAPIPTGGSALSAFTGTNPNGSWRLFIVDDESTDAGSSSGWCLNLRPICAVNADCADGNPCTTDTCSVSGVCNHLPNTAACNDGNPCTVNDACASGSCNPGTPAPPPPEVTGLSAAAIKGTYNWSAAPPATNYDVLRASIGALPIGPGGGDETCFPNVGGTTVTDGSVPTLGTGYGYLARGEWTCGVGTYGKQSNGTPRVSTTCP